MQSWSMFLFSPPWCVGDHWEIGHLIHYQPLFEPTAFTVWFVCWHVVQVSNCWTLPSASLCLSGCIIQNPHRYSNNGHEEKTILSVRTNLLSHLWLVHRQAWYMRLLNKTSHQMHLHFEQTRIYVFNRCLVAVAGVVHIWKNYTFRQTGLGINLSVYHLTWHSCVRRSKE